MRVVMTAALAGAYLFIAPVLTTVGAEVRVVPQPNETVVFKTTPEGTWPIKVKAQRVVYIDI